MGKTKGYLLLIGLNIGLAFSTCFCFAQEKQEFQVFKLERKIGTEEVSSVRTGDSSTVEINIRTNDRGYILALKANLTETPLAIKIISNGNTSRFKKEAIDTLTSASRGFPFSESGSIKMREMLIAFWQKVGSPQVIKSSLDGSEISIEELDRPDGIFLEKGFRVFLINHGTDEVFWTDKEGKSAFLTTNDTETDKREVIADQYLSEFTALNQQSTNYLLGVFKKKVSTIAKSYESIAILGGNIIDLTGKGSLQENTMVLINHGTIDYVGKIEKSLIPLNAHLIDASNKFLIPGLWNMHVHLFHPSYLKKELLSGVTTVRDMANEFDFIVRLKDLSNNGSIPAPKVYAAGVLDGQSSSTLGIMLATNAAEIKENVKRYHEAGFSQIKI